LLSRLGGDIVYEPEKMTNLEGATGPFVQYSFARASSILKKFKTDRKPSESSEGRNFEDSELALLRWIYRYPEVIEEAGRTLSPHMLVTYVTELAARFNTFYQNCRVEEEGKVNGFRYELVEAVANVLSSGLNTLGIVAPSEM
jgi:arginyl-tRNA synthetase